MLIISPSRRVRRLAGQVGNSTGSRVRQREQQSIDQTGFRIRRTSKIAIMASCERCRVLVRQATLRINSAGKTQEYKSVRIYFKFIHFTQRADFRSETVFLVTWVA